ncbi:MAG: sugar phosphate isomerase/epimerase family protein [Acidobacteriota bacterium]
MTRVGVSTGVLTDKRDLDTLLAFRPEVVEFYNYPTSALPWIARICSDHGIQPALHTPVPYDQPEPLRRFAPTGPDPEEVRQARDLALATLRCAAELSALHVVVHYPSPYPEAHGEIDRAAEADFLAPLAEEADRSGVPLLIENLSAHPTCRLPEHYEELLERYPELGFCLDFGHAHDTDSVAGVPRFAQALGRRIRSCHVYNTKNDGATPHEPFSRHHRAADGWLNPRAAVAAVLEHADPPVLILEPRPLAADEIAAAVAGADWLRELVAAGEDRQ